MEISDIVLLNIKKTVENILMMPGIGIKEGDSFEICIVMDENSSKDYLNDTSKKIVSKLKMNQKLFRNVRCNVVYAGGKSGISTRVVPMSFIQMGKGYEPENLNKLENNTDDIDYLEDKNSKSKIRLDDILPYLKKFQARSKCVILLTEHGVDIGDINQAKEGLVPFLKSRLIIVTGQNMEKMSLAKLRK